MKKIIFLSLLFGIFFQTNANRDDVNNFNFSTTIAGNYNVYVETVNNACSDGDINKEKRYEGNIFDVLNFTGIGGANCYKKDGNLRCDATPGGYGNSRIPPGLLPYEFKLHGSYNQILNRIGVPLIITSQINESIYKQNMSAQLALIVDSDNKVDQSRDTNFDFSFGGDKPLFEKPINYCDPDACSIKPEEISGSGEVDENKEEKKWDLEECTVTEPPLPPDICGGIIPCITTQKTPPELEKVSIDGCLLNGDTYYCLSKENSLNLKIKFKLLGSYSSIKKININVNNSTNNGASFNNNSAYVNLTNIEDTQESSIKIDGNGVIDFTKVNSYNIEVSGYGELSDDLRTIDNVSRSNVEFVKVKIIPNNNFKIDGSLTSTTTNPIYADNSSTKTICGKITDSNGNNLGLRRGVSVGIVDGIKTDRVGNTGVEGLSITSKSFYSSTSKICFDIKSAAPAKKDLKFNISLQKHNDFYDGTTMNYTTMPDLSVGPVEFKKIYVGELQSSKDGINYTAKPEIGTSMKYKVISKLIINTTISNFSIADYSSYIKPKENLKVEGLTGLILGSPSTFSLRLNTVSNALIQPGIIIKDQADKSPIIISYKLGGKTVKYYLSTLDDALDRTPLSITGDTNSFLGVKVIGNLQGSGKQELTGQSSNFTDLSKSELRTQIRKNAYNFIKSMSGNTISNNVKYVVGNYTIEPNPTYETLVVKNGNVKINRNITNSKFGIIVLKDSYDVNNGYEAGNIIVLPSVTSLNGLFYADGGFVSGNSIGDIYTIDSTTRTNALKNQLILSGSLFTRNTIGGAILGTSGEYILPGGSETTDFNRAMVYDLNYIRRGTNGWDLNGNGRLNSGEYNNYGFVVKYNPNLIISSPKLFNLK